MDNQLAPEHIVAFLQNPWFKPETDEDTIKKYREDVKFRRRLLSMSPTGERLFLSFGEEWFNKIWWDNANPKHGAHWSAKYEADIEHMAGVIALRSPILVITFGVISTRGWLRMLTVPGAGNYYKSITHMRFSHPMAYGVSIKQLEEFALRIKMATT